MKTLRNRIAKLECATSTLQPRREEQPESPIDQGYIQQVIDKATEILNTMREDHRALVVRELEGFYQWALEMPKFGEAAREAWAEREPHRHAVVAYICEMIRASIADEYKGPLAFPPRYVDGWLRWYNCEKWTVNDLPAHAKNGP